MRGLQALTGCVILVVVLLSSGVGAVPAPGRGPLEFPSPVVTKNGFIRTVVGNGTPGPSGDGQPATAAAINFPRAVTVDAGGNLFVTDTYNNRIRQVDPDGRIITVAGNGVAGYSGDGGPAIDAAIFRPHGVAVDNRGHLFIADSPNHRIRMVDLPTGVIRTVPGFSGDGGPATAAQLNRPRFVVPTSDGALLVADTDNHRIRRVDQSGIITTVAGTGVGGSAGDGGPASAAQLDDPRGLALDHDGDLYVADAVANRLRRIDRDGVIRTVAGTGNPGYSGDVRPADQAALNEPRAVAVDGADNIFIADAANHRVRRIDHRTGLITTIAGTAESGFTGDGGPAALATLSDPYGVFVDRAGRVLLTDTGNNRVRQVSADPAAQPAG
jgi:sugar lactone lactonase YvrE